MPPVAEDPPNMSDGHGLSCEEQRREELKGLLENVAEEVTGSLCQWIIYTKSFY